MLRLYNLKRGRWLPFVLLLTLISTLSMVDSVAQVSNESVERGIVRIKVTPAYAASLERANGRSGVNVVATGSPALNALNTRFKATSMKRVFPNAGKFEAKHRKYGLHLWYEVAVDNTQPTAPAVAAYSSVAEIQRAEPVYKKKITGIESMKVTPVAAGDGDVEETKGFFDDPRFSDQWHYHNVGQVNGTPGADIDLPNAWKMETGNKEVIIAVIDGGIELDHPDLKNSLWTNVGEIPGNDIDDDNNGFVDDIHGYSFIDNSPVIQPFFHGTHIAGTIAATNNNGIGVSGVAGGSGNGDGVRLMTCATFQGTFEDLFSVTAGGMAPSFIYAADNGAVIAQNSWGYGPNIYEQVVLDAIDYFIAEAGTDANGNQTGLMKGGIVIFSAGNSDANMAFYPGYYPPTLAVSSTSNRDVKASYSNYGKWVDIASPGGSGAPLDITDPLGVMSTWVNGGYAWASGTSMASPHVSGIAGLVLSKFGGPGYTPQMLRERLLSAVDDIDAVNPNYKGMLGVGRINALKALHVAETLAPDPVTDLTATLTAGNTASLEWTAPEDHGNGVATYDIRYSTSEITAENFNAGFPAAKKIVAKFPGNTESLSIAGLLPGTTYYFAVKAIDLSGNYSSLSDVAVITAENVAFTVTPGILATSLHTTETGTESFTITNTGTTAITLSLSDSAALQFVNVSPETGTVGVGEALVVAATFNAVALLPGTYHQEIKITTNVSGDVILPVVLNVATNGTPIASVSDDAFEFGDVMLGLAAEKKLWIYNTGGDVLELTSSIDHVDFSTVASISVPPLDSAELVIRYNPSGLGQATAELVLQTNDAENETIKITLSGTGSAAPGIEVTPTSFTEHLVVNGTASRQITIRNTGDYELTYAIKPQENPTPFITAGVKPVRTKILVLSPDTDLHTLQVEFNKFDGVDTSFPLNTWLEGITIDDLTPYDLIYVGNSTRWSGQADPVKIGDLLADYIDQGGKVIVNNFTYSADSTVGLHGRFIDENYGPFTNGDAVSYGPVAMGPDDILVPNHPVLEGVDEILYGGVFFYPRIESVGLAPGAQALAKWQNGDYFLAVKNNVVALNVMAVEGHDGQVTVEGDIFKLYENAIRWLTEPTYIKVADRDGVVAPGQEKKIEILFDAAMLLKEEYKSFITIATNVPEKEHIHIPVTLFVDQPAFVATPAVVTAVVQKGEKAVETFTIRNNGTSTFPVAIDVGKSRPEYSFKFLQLSSNGQPTPLDGSSSNGYFTNFENFEVGAFAEQHGWFAESSEPGVITISPEKAVSGGKCLRMQTKGRYSARVISAVEKMESEYSTIRMKLYFEGLGTTWSFATVSGYNYINELDFLADGTIIAVQLPGDGIHRFEPLPVKRPQGGYFDFAVETERATGVYKVFFDDELVYTGKGLPALDNARFIFTSYMENSGVNLFMDDVSITDGPHTALPSFVSLLSAATANLAPGQALEVKVEMDSEKLPFGKYLTDILVNVADGAQQIVVPAMLAIEGDAAVAIVSDTIMATAPFGEKDTTYLQINNTGGTPLHYTLEVEGGAGQAKWMDYSSTSGTIPVNDIAGILFYMDAENLASGDYTAKLKVSTDVPGSEEIEVTAILKVLPPPRIVVSPDTLYHTITINGDWAFDTLNITNASEGVLRFSVKSSGKTDVPELTFPYLDEQIDLAANRYRTIDYYMSSEVPATGMYYDTVVIESNDPVSPIIKVPVVSKVITPSLLELSHSEITHEGEVGTITSASITVSNLGETKLLFSILGLDDPLMSFSPWLNVDVDYGELKQDSTTTMTFAFDATALTEGIYYDTMYFSASQPGLPTLLIPITFTVTPKLITGIPSEQRSQDWVAYPNPTAGDVTITHRNKAVSEMVAIVVRNNQGQVVLKSETPYSSANAYQIHLRTLPPGLYHVNVQEKSGKGSNLKIIRK